MKKAGLTQFYSSKGVQVHCRYAIAQNSKANVVCLHDWLGQSGRFSRLTERLTKEGFSIIAPDMPGHGYSEGHRGKVEDYQDWLGIVHQVVALMDDSTPLFLLGKGFGANLALLYGVESPSSHPFIAGSVLINPSLILNSAPVSSLPKEVGLPSLPRADLIDEQTFRQLSLIHQGTTKALVDSYLPTLQIQMAGSQVMRLFGLESADENTQLKDAKYCFQRIGAMDKLFQAYPFDHTQLKKDLLVQTMLDDLLQWLNQRFMSRNQGQYLPQRYAMG